MNRGFDIDFYPPFEGFPKEGISFFRRLKKNNNRPWFEKHKNEYEEFARIPMQSLIASLQPAFARFAPEYELNPKRAIFRIYRDIRFSKDKTPYKTHIAAHFVSRSTSKGLEGSGFYLHIDPEEAFIGGGIYMPDGDQMKKIRAAIAGHGAEFLSIVNGRAFKKSFGVLSGEKLKRIPHGYDEDHPMAEWLKLKQFFVGASWPPTRARKPSFVDDVAKACERAMPLVSFLNRAIR